MAEKKVKKKVSRSSGPSAAAIDRLIHSNAALQHKMADVLIGVKELNKNVSSMVSVFKKAGEHIQKGKYEDPLVNRLNTLLDQNKNLVEALCLLEDQIKEKNAAPRANPLEPRSY